jgi:hypothetical protein
MVLKTRLFRTGTSDLSRNINLLGFVVKPEQDWLENDELLDEYIPFVTGSR